MVTIVLVDGLPLFREGFAALAHRQPDLTLAGHAGSLDEALALVVRVVPDVVVCESALSDGAPLEPARQILHLHPRQQLLVLSTVARPDMAAEAFRLGARGYALKSESSEALFGAVRAVAAGEEYVSPILPRDAVDHLRIGRPCSSRSGDPLGALSRRERQIYRLLVQGETNRHIADRLAISVRTVETHRAHILRKLHVHSLSDLLRIALQQGMLLRQGAA